MGQRLSFLRWSTIFTSSLFVIYFVAFRPTLNSDDDFYFLYTLAGGHGAPPTNNIHYIYTLHPVLTWPIAKLFQLYATINWYSVFLVSMHLISCINLLNTFLSFFNRFYATTIFLIFFLFIESHLLLSLNYSNASLSVAVSGLTSLLALYFDKPASKTEASKELVSSIIIVIVAGLLRVHMLGLCMLLISWMALSLLPFRKFLDFLRTLFVISLIIGSFVLVHKYYYQKVINGWNREEMIRQSLFITYNRPQKEPPKYINSIQSIKTHLINSLFLYDTTFIRTQDILHYKATTTTTRRMGEWSSLALYWTFINNRVYLLLLFGFFLYFFLSRNHRLLTKWMLIASASIFLYFFLFFFYKITDSIFFALFSSIIIAVIFLLKEAKFQKWPFIVSSAVILLSCFWVFIRLKKENATLIREANLTRCAIKELNNNSDTLFINTGNIMFPYGSFFAWDCPVNYPLKNLIYKELILTNSYTETLRSFKVKDLIHELPRKRNILLIGTIQPALKPYYQHTKNWKIVESNVQGFKCINAYKLNLISSDLNL